jgi:hypothetical protein
LEEIVIHNVNYSFEELKKLVVSKTDSEMIHLIKRYMHKITVDFLPGEVFRKYPIKINFAYKEFRKFLQSDEFNEYNIEVSNYGRVRINGKIEKQIEEKEGWFYVKSKNIYYPVWRFVAEVWCEFPFEDTFGWQVHHISNDGNNNTPENLIWIKDTSHNFIPKYAIDKMQEIFYKVTKDEYVNNVHIVKNIGVDKMVEIINSPDKLLEEFIYSTILHDDILNKKLSDLCSVDPNEKIDLKKWGFLNYLDSFMENIICKDEYYKTLFDSIDDDKIKKIKIQFQDYLKKLIENNGI